MGSRGAIFYTSVHSTFTQTTDSICDTIASCCYSRQLVCSMIHGQQHYTIQTIVAKFSKNSPPPVVIFLLLFSIYNEINSLATIIIDVFQQPQQLQLPTTVELYLFHNNVTEGMEVQIPVVYRDASLVYSLCVSMLTILGKLECAGPARQNLNTA